MEPNRASSVGVWSRIGGLPSALSRAIPTPVVGLDFTDEKMGAARSPMRVPWANLHPSLSASVAETQTTHAPRVFCSSAENPASGGVSPSGRNRKRPAHSRFSANPSKTMGAWAHGRVGAEGRARDYPPQSAPRRLASRPPATHPSPASRT